MTKDELDLIFNCMCALAAIDGDFAPQEAKILEAFSKDSNLKPSLHPMDLIAMKSSEIELIFDNNLSKILSSKNSNEVLFELFHHLNELAGADELFHANEKALIKKIGSKIRDAELQKINIMIIVGEKEVDNQTLTIRRRFVKEQKELSFEEFSKDIISEIKERRVSN